MRRQNRWLMYGVIAALGYYAWTRYQQLQASRRLAQPVQTAAERAAVASSAPSTYNF